MTARSHSRSDLLCDLLFGRPTRGAVYGRRELRFGDYIVSITLPGSPRMPNGIECDLRVRSRDKVAVGGGRIVVGATAVDAGPEWDPVPAAVDRHGVLRAGATPLVQVLPGRQLPDGDEVLAGYLAGLVLLHGQSDRALRMASAAAPRTDPLHATLLRHAARGEVPEPIHALLATGDAKWLLAFNGASGQSWLRGLLSAGYPIGVEAMHHRAVEVTVGGEANGPSPQRRAALRET